MLRNLVALRKLVPGKDYAGKGTAESPFLFGSHLQFHRASYALLNQMGIDAAKCSRAVDYDGAGRLCDRWTTPAGDYWFQLPIST
jgi:hypothetical protein